MANLNYLDLHIHEVYTQNSSSISDVRTTFQFRMRMYDFAGNFGGRVVEKPDFIENSVVEFDLGFVNKQDFPQFSILTYYQLSIYK